MFRKIITKTQGNLEPNEYMKIIEHMFGTIPTTNRCSQGSDLDKMITYIFSICNIYAELEKWRGKKLVVI